MVVEGEKEKATIASSRLLFEGERGGDLRTSSTASRRLVSASNRVTSTPNHLAAPFHTHFPPRKHAYLLIPDRPSRYFLTFHFLSTLGRGSAGRAPPPGFRSGPSPSLRPPPPGRREGEGVGSGRDQEVYISLLSPPSDAAVKKSRTAVSWHSVMAR